MRLRRSAFTLWLLAAPAASLLMLGAGRSEFSAPVRAPPPACCICINCKLVDRCKLYHWVEEMHEQPHVTGRPDFDPPDPQVQVFLRNESDASAAAADASRFLSTEYDVFACDSFIEEQGKWLKLMPDAEYIPT